MLRTLSPSATHSRTPLVLMIAGLVSLVAVTACGGSVDTSADTASTQEQALTEAQSSYSDAKAAAEACFATFDTCKSATGADVATCETALHACLPKEAGPGPHCGGPPHPGGPGGPGGADHDGDGPKPPEGGPPPPPDGAGPGAGAPPPPPANGDAPPPRPEGGKPGGPRGEGKDHPGFCKKVPLPPPPELAACHDALHACVAGGGDRKACFDADRACVKAAFDAAFTALCATNTGDERLTKLCAGGVAPPAPTP